MVRAGDALAFRQPPGPFAALGNRALGRHAVPRRGRVPVLRPRCGGVLRATPGPMPALPTRRLARIGCLLWPDEVAERELGLARCRTDHEVPQVHRVSAFDVCTPSPGRSRGGHERQQLVGDEHPGRPASARPAARSPRRRARAEAGVRSPGRSSVFPILGARKRLTFGGTTGLSDELASKMHPAARAWGEGKAPRECQLHRPSHRDLEHLRNPSLRSLRFR